MRIRVRFFAALRDMTGYQMLNLEFPKKVSSAEVMAYLEGEFAGISSVLRSSAVAVNGEYRDPHVLLGAGDELAVLPPVSGGSPAEFLTREAIDLREFLTQGGNHESGASILFLGTCRGHSKGRKVLRLEYEAYEEMAEKVISRLVDAALGQWSLQKVRLLHRVGIVELGGIAVAIEVRSTHRKEAYEASRFLIEEIKHSAPIWKKEYFEDGTGEWSLCPSYAELSASAL